MDSKRFIFCRSAIEQLSVGIGLIGLKDLFYHFDSVLTTEGDVNKGLYETKFVKENYINFEDFCKIENRRNNIEEILKK